MREAHVVRTTTDKLQGELNRFAEAECPVEKVEYCGGRDWVVVAGLSEQDPWYQGNWAAGRPGLLPRGFCNIYPADGTPIPCMYQRDHIGRHHFEQANGDIVPDVCHQHTEDEPLLGLATTRQLLTEVAMRMEITQNSTGGRDLGRLCESAIEELDKGVLDYSTVHPSGNGFVISRMP